MKDKDGLPDHFLMGPSSASRWLVCSGSLDHPSDGTAGEAAKIGTLCHSIVESRLRNKPLSAEDFAYHDSLSKQLQNELKEAVELCVNYVKGIGLPTVRLETKIQSAFLEEHGGTADVIATDDYVLHVVDYKFGRVKVDIEGNAQVGCYINLARQLYPNAKKFLGTIIQPFNGGVVGPYEFSTSELDALDKNVIRSSITREYVAGDHCVYCPILQKCKTAANFVKSQLSAFPDLTKIAAESGGNPIPDEVELVAKIYKTYKIAESGSEGAAVLLKSWGRRGVDIQKHGLGLRYSNTHRWNDDAERILANSDIEREDLGKFVLHSPAQLRQQLGMTKEAFEADFRAAININEVETLVIGKGGKRDFSEFPEL